MLSHMKRYAETNRETVLAKKRAWAKRWAAENPDEKKRRAETDRVKHYDRIRVQQLAWAKANPLKEAQRGARDSARRRGARKVTNPLTEAQWADIKEYFGHACAYCLRVGMKLEKDHVVAVTRGGEHSEDNVVPSCRNCNARKRDQPVFVMAA